MGTKWIGKEYKSFSRVTTFPPQLIDRTCVRFYKTLYGEPYFVVEGSRKGCADWYPLTEDMPDSDMAWARKCEIDRELQRDRARFGH